MNKLKLKAVIMEHGQTQKQLAQAIGLSTSALNERMNGKKVFRQDEMCRIKEHYNLTAEDMQAIFFAAAVS